MSIDYNKYEAVIGLEVHAQMLTKSKAFCGDAVEYGASPNTLVSPISLGHPGTLPVHNKEAVKNAVKLGVACGCDIAEHNYYARKNYFYADLPKGYQISQHNTPICENGHIDIKLKDGSEKRIGLIRIHMEEDTGKSMHDQDVYDTLIDYNRAGTALIEMVSLPDIRTGEEAYQFLTEVRKLVRYLGICDGNMEEGSMRCDANVSVRLRGAKEFGVKVEVKNMNSIRNVQRAIDHEIKRQIEAIENGEKIYQETRTFEATKGITIVMRTKEGASDYRYFPEPDLPPLHITQHFIDEVKSQMPALPGELFDKFTTEFGLSAYDANVLIDDQSIALGFINELQGSHIADSIKLKSLTDSDKLEIKKICNWFTSQIKGYLNTNALSYDTFRRDFFHVGRVSEMVSLTNNNVISSSIASGSLFDLAIQNPDKKLIELVNEYKIYQESNSNELQQWIDAAIAKYPEKVTEYKGGKVSLVGLFMGEVMKLSKGKADPKVASQMVKDTLDRA